MLDGSCRAAIAPKDACSSSDAKDGSVLGALPKTHWLGEKPPSLAVSFLTWQH